MRRVLIIGSGGAGKSTFASRLSRRTGLPLIHLDSLYWQPGWIETPAAEWDQTIEQLLGRDTWIMDGNYGRTLERRLAACDTVIFLDLPRLLCLQRIIRRRLQFHGRSRPDMREGCPERLSWEYIQWVWTYPERRRPGILARLAALEPEKQVYENTIIVQPVGGDVTIKNGPVGWYGDHASHVSSLAGMFSVVSI